MRILFSVLLLVAVGFSSGCVAILAGAAGGAGTAYWISNKLGQDVNGPLEQVVNAAKQGLTDLKVPITKETRETGFVQLRSEYAEEEPIWVDVRSLSSKSCRIEVRVGLVGNKEATRKVLEAILKRL